MRADTSDALTLTFDYLRVSKAESSVERLVLYSLAGRVNRSRGDWLAWPTLSRMAEVANVSHATARRALVRLVQRGILTVVREGIGRGNPTVYRLEKVPMWHLLSDPKTSHPAVGKGTKPDPPVQRQSEVQDPTGSTSPSAEADAVALADLWNRTMTSPIPHIRLPLSEDRVRRYARAFRSLTVEEWTQVLLHVNTQDWCRAPGTGDHPNWTATLDWLTKSPSTWQRHLEKAQTTVSRQGPRTRSEAYRQTNERNAQSVGTLPTFMTGGHVDDEDEAR